MDDDAQEMEDNLKRNKEIFDYPRKQDTELENMEDVIILSDQNIEILGKYMKELADKYKDLVLKIKLFNLAFMYRESLQDIFETLYNCIIDTEIPLYDSLHHLNNYKDVIRNYINYFKEYTNKKINENVIKTFNLISAERIKKKSYNQISSFIKIKDNSIYINDKINNFDTITIIDDLNKLLIDLDDIVTKVRKEYKELEIHVSFNYQQFLNDKNPNVWAFLNSPKLTPGTFRLFQVNTKRENDKYLSQIQDNFFHYGLWDGSNIEDVYSHIEYEPGSDLIDPGYRRYSGWKKDDLFTALKNTGLFDYSKQRFGSVNCYAFDKLSKLHIENPHPTKSDDPNSQLNRIPRYTLEMLYSKLINTTPNWKEIFSGDYPVEAIRKLAEKEFGVIFLGELPELKAQILNHIYGK
jgi:hypothetical protein